MKGFEKKKDSGTRWRRRLTAVFATLVALRITAMYLKLVSFTALAGLPLAIGQSSVTPAALNKTNTNLIPNGQGPILYYNGTGPVPPYDELSPPPVPITPVQS